MFFASFNVIASSDWYVIERDQVSLNLKSLLKTKSNLLCDLRLIFVFYEEFLSWV